MNNPHRWLDETRSLVVPALRKAVDRLDPFTRTVVSYHLGWVDEDGEPTRDDGGKALRPALVLAGARATGSDPSQVVHAAVAVELVHNFSLVHDDIMDRDLTRRHRATVWSVWDESTAILAGDAMCSLAREVLLEDPDPRAAQAALILERATRDLIHGQVQDLDFEGRTRVPLAECEAMSSHKTAALLAASTSMGGVLGGGNPAQVRALQQFGSRIGLAFQVIDDVLGIWGDPEVTGKSNHSDLRSKKKSLPVTWALEQPGDSADWLRHWFGAGDTDDDAIAEAARRLEELGAREWAGTRADDLVRAAGQGLHDAELDARAVDELQQLADFICVRRA